MVALGEFLKIKIGPRPEKPLCKMTDSELQQIIDSNAAIMARESKNLTGTAYREAHFRWSSAHSVLDRLNGEYLISR